MNISVIIAIIAALVIGGAAGGTVMSKKQDNNNQVVEQRKNETVDSVDYVSPRPQIAALPTEDVSDAEREGLLFMREEEKLARDVYTALGEKWGMRIFSNIAQSEQTHTEAIRTLLVKYDIADPVVDDTVGSFENAVLDELYTDLVAQGSASLEAALGVGALIEDLDIADLQKYIAEVDNEDISLVYENLLRGSRNHLRAFTSQLTSRGEVYTPKYITQEDFDTIISSERETGEGKGDHGDGGKGGRGWGNR